MISRRVDVQSRLIDQLANQISGSSPTLLHVQLADAIRALIDRQSLAAGTRLPGEPELAAKLGISRGTLRRAVQTLVTEGQLVQAHGRGTFVASNAINQFPTQRLISIAEAFDLRHAPFETEVLSAGPGTLPVEIAEDLGSAFYQGCFRLERVRRVDGEPVAYLVNYVREDKCPQIERFEFAKVRLFDVIEQEYGLQIESGHRTFEAQVATGRIAALLHLAEGLPVLYLSQVTYLADGEPIEYSDVWIPGDRMRLSAMLSRA